MRHFSAIIAALALAGAAWSTEQISPKWNGKLDNSKRYGVLLVAPPGAYDAVGFEAMSSVDEIMRPLIPGMKWQTIDSAHPLIDNLKGADLDSVSIRLLADNALWVVPTSSQEGLIIREPKLGETARKALRQTGAAFHADLLIALRRGGAQNEKDSSASFQDKAWFGIFDLRKGTLLYSREVEAHGSKSEALSAESAWSRSAWEEFAKGLKDLPERRKKAESAEPK